MTENTPFSTGAGESERPTGPTPTSTFTFREETYSATECDTAGHPAAKRAKTMISGDDGGSGVNASFQVGAGPSTAFEGGGSASSGVTATASTPTPQLRLRSRDSSRSSSPRGAGTGNTPSTADWGGGRSSPAEKVDPVYERCWSRLVSMTAVQCERSEIAAAYGCTAVRVSRGSQRLWGAQLGDGGTLGKLSGKDRTLDILNRSTFCIEG